MHCGAATHDIGKTLHPEELTGPGARHEDRVVAELCRGSGRARWEEFLRLDEVLARIGEGAEARLAYQAVHPVRG